MKGWCDYMSDMKMKEIMTILERERIMELKCADKSKELMKKTLNPFRRIACKKMYKTFIDHSIGIQLAQNALKRAES